MKFSDFTAEVKSLVADASAAEGHPEIAADASVPPSPDYGDLSSSAPIRVAKALGKKPAEVAVSMASLVAGRVGDTRYVGSVSPHRGGYLNFTIRYPEFINDSVSAVLSGDLGQALPSGRKVAVEHTNVNPNKALHIGHARNLVLGDSLVRVLRQNGDEVQALDYVDDSGAQVADVIVGLRFMGLPEEPQDGQKFDEYCGDKVYTKVTAQYAQDPGLKQKQALVLAEVEKGEGDLADYTRRVVKRILAAQLETCWRLNASYDLLNWESQIVHSGMWERMFELMKGKGLVKLETEGENKGCWVIPDAETGEQKVVVRSDGTVVYVAKDIPYAAWKIGLAGDPFEYEVYATQHDGRILYSTSLGGKGESVSFGSADLAVSVIDARQSYLQRIVAKVLGSLEDGASKRYLHRAYEVVALSKRTSAQMGFQIEGEFAHMSGRKGLYVNVDRVLNELKKKATSETARRNPGEAREWVDEVAEALAVAALRYELLKQDPDKMIIFDLEESLNLQGDTGPYLLYTYARARRILEKAEVSPAISPSSAAKLTRPQEKNLAKTLSMLDISVAAAKEYLSPREVAKFAHGLAAAFNEFYEGVQVIREEDPELKKARLALVDAASRVLERAMALMGIPSKGRI
jgi:arginyl-tRNA synthetase